MGHNNQVLKSLVLSLAFIAGNVFCEVMHLETGTDHTFKPNIPPGEKMETILWKYKSDKVVEYEFLNNEWIPSWYRLKDRGNLNTDNGEFTLRNLQKTDSGLYESEIQVNKKLQYSTHDVRVIDPLHSPKITCEEQGGNKTLSCSLHPYIPARFKWSGPNDFKHIGQSFVVPQGLGPDTTYYCTVTNEVSKNSIEFKLKDCEKDGGLSGTTIAIISVATIVGAAVVIAGLAYCCGP